MIEQRPLGDGVVVSAVGLGCMPFSGTYGSTDDGESVAAIRRALEVGVTLLDTADVYGLGHNERLVGRAIAGRRDEVVVATKFGTVFDEHGGRAGTIDGRPEYVRRACEASLARLNVETIDLYQQHRVDPATPVEETIGALVELVDAGKVRHIGLSEAMPEDIRRAHAVHPLASVQSEYSLFERGIEGNGALSTCAELGIGLLAFAPLGRGLLAGSLDGEQPLEADDKRESTTMFPRVGPAHRAANAALAGVVREVAHELEATMAQVALAWLLARDARVVPIPGSRRAERIEENAGASGLALPPAALAKLDGLAARVSGPRYGPDRPQPGWVSPPLTAT